MDILLNLGGVQRKLGHLVPHLTEVLDLLYGFLSIFLHTSSDRELILVRTMLVASLEAPPSDLEALPMVPISPTDWPESSVHPPWKSRPLAPGATLLFSS